MEYEDDDPYVYDDDIPRTEAEVHRAAGMLQLSLSSSSQSSGVDNATGQAWTCWTCGAGPSTPIFVLSSPSNTPCTLCLFRTTFLRCLVHAHR